MSLLSFIIEQSKFIGLFILLAIAAQFILGNPRWQFYPLYLLALIYFIILAMHHYDMFDINRRSSRWIIGIGIFLILISVLFLLIFPMDKLPVPRGQFEVGTRIYDLEDTERDEAYTEAQNDSRRLKYQIWYPTEETEGYRKAKWITEGKTLTRHLAGSMHLPPFMLDHTENTYSNSYLDAPIKNSEERYPVVIISHGWQGFRELHTDFAEELASHGFIAVSIDHTYGSQAVRFNDGTVAYLSPEALPNQSNPVFSRASRVLVKTFGEDVASVLDDLEMKNAEDGDLRNLMNLEAVGTIGHSTGGGGIVSIALEDTRIKALLGLDAWVSPVGTVALQEGLDIPLLFLRSEQWSFGPNNTSLNTLIRNSDEVTLVQMNKTTHVDLTMTYMFSPLTKYIRFTGEKGGRYSSEIQREFIISFFNQTLRQQGDAEEDNLIEIINRYDHLQLID